MKRVGVLSHTLLLFMTIDILYVHLPGIGNFVYDEIPDFARISVAQSRKNHSGKIVFICQKPEAWFEDYDVEWFDLNRLPVSSFERWGKINLEVRKETVFWNLTMIRMLVLNHYTKFHSKADYVLSLEYDNLIYQNTDTLNDFCNGKIRYCPVSKIEHSPGIMLLPTGEYAHKFDELFRIFSETMRYRVTDMTVLERLSKTMLVDSLPVLPSWDSSMLFDGASYGQWYGGTNNGHPAGFTDPLHYVGQALNNKVITLKPDMPPEVILGEESYPIFNLHIHSKKLEQFV